VNNYVENWMDTINIITTYNVFGEKMKEESERKGGSYTKEEEIYPNKKPTPHNKLEELSRVFNQHNQLRSLVRFQQQAPLRIQMRK
jgi:hypothetical protein